MKAWRLILATACFALVKAGIAADANSARPPATRTPASSTAQTAAPGPLRQTQPIRVPAKSSPDRLDLDATVVTGNRELPRVLYIVPWKKAELGDLPDQPFNTLLDEALAPIDRDEFRREISYFSKLTDRTPTRGAGSPQVAPEAKAPAQ